MTPKEKAIELMYKFYDIDSDSEMYDGFKMGMFYAQRCALIAVDEIMKSHKELGAEMYQKVGTDSYQDRCLNYDKGKYWQKVRNEIEKL